MKATKNLWTMFLGVFPKSWFSPQMNTDETRIHQNSFCH
jgi:hypothetical protein